MASITINHYSSLFITNKPGNSRLNVPICKQNDRTWTPGPLDVAHLLLQRLEIVTTGIQFIDHQAPPQAMSDEQKRGSGLGKCWWISWEFMGFLGISWGFMGIYGDLCGFMWIYVDLWGFMGIYVDWMRYNWYNQRNQYPSKLSKSLVANARFISKLLRCFGSCPLERSSRS